MPFDVKVDLRLALDALRTYANNINNQLDECSGLVEAT